MMEEIKIKIEGEEALKLIKFAAQHGGQGFAEALPRTSAALFKAAQDVRGTWVNYLMDYPSSDFPRLGIKDIPRPSSALSDSVKITPNESGKFDYEVYSEHPYMADLQNGRDETIDMKAPDSPWLNGKKSRINKKDGSPYLIVPFDWSVGAGHFRSVVPASIQRALRRRALTRTLATTHPEPNARGEQIERNEYGSLENGNFKSGWGGRISAEDAARYKVRDDEAATNGVSADEVRSRVTGMVRMWDSRYGINGNHGTYFTFRIISIKSKADAWIQRRHLEKRDIVGALKRELEQYINDVVKEGFYADFKAGF